MAKVPYFSHRLFTTFIGIQFMYLQYSRPLLIYDLLPNVWKVSYTISASTFAGVPYWTPYSTDKFITCVVPGPYESQRSTHCSRLTEYCTNSSNSPCSCPQSWQLSNSPSSCDSSVASTFYPTLADMKFSKFDARGVELNIHWRLSLFCFITNILQT